VKPKLLVNENFPVPAILKLRQNGIDVLAVQEAMPGASDEAILMHACTTGRWLVTYDRDYGELVYSKACPAPPSILYLRQEPFPPDHAADLVMNLLNNPTDAAGFLVVIGSQTIRRRRLPGIEA